MNKATVNYLMLVCISIFIFNTSYHWYDSDYFWHIKGGIEFLKHPFFDYDSLSWISEEKGYKWVMHEWLFDVAIGYGYQMFGHWYSYILIFIIFTSTYIVIFNHIRKTTSDIFAIYFIAVTWFLIFNYETLLVGRPQMVSYLLFTIIVIYFANTKISDITNKHIMCLFVISVIWANIHGGASIIGLVIALIYMISNMMDVAIYSKDHRKHLYRGFAMIIAMLIGMMINPHFYYVFVYTFETLKDETAKNISEWLPPTLDKESWYRLVFLFVQMGVLGYKVYVERCRKDYNKESAKQLFHILLSFSMMYLFLNSMRHFTMYGITVAILSAPYIFKALNKIRSNYSSIFNYLNFRLMANLFVVGLLVLTGFSFQKTLNEKNALSDIYPVETVKWMKENNEEDRVLNSYHFGGFLLFNDIQSFIDGRTDIYLKTMYNQSPVFTDYVNIRNVTNGYDLFIEKYKPDRILLDRDKERLLVTVIEKDIRYEKIHEDGVSVLFKRTKVL